MSFDSRSHEFSLLADYERRTSVGVPAGGRAERTAPHPVTGPAAPTAGPPPAPTVLPERTVEDLGIREIARRLASRRLRETDALKILSELQTDQHVIRYRQEILEDFVNARIPESEIEDLLEQIDELVFFADTRKTTDSELLQAIWRLGELELYIDCVEALGDLLSRRVDIRSDGLRKLGEILDGIRTSDQFVKMKSELPKLREGLKQRKSVTIGVNLDERLRPVEATLVSVNKTRFAEGSLLGRLFGSSGSRSEYTSLTPIHATPTPSGETGTEFPLSPLFKDIEVLLRSLAHPVAETLKSYLRVNTGFMRSLAPELSFFLGAARLCRRLREHGLTLCKPVLAPASEATADLGGLYNLQLALRRMREAGDANEDLDIVTNDLRMTSAERLFILTGPNQGGKTTFTQAIGIIQVLAQAGVFVPAARARISPVDHVLTHFPVGEQGQITTGRLAEEAERLAEIFATITGTSLVLMNESLSSTSPGESLYLAEDIVRALSVLGARAVFATHLHELAARAETLSSDGAGKIVSLVAEVDQDDMSEHRRTYRIVPGPPTGKSFARDIADQFGISYSALETLLRNRGVL